MIDKSIIEQKIKDLETEQNNVILSYERIKGGIMVLKHLLEEEDKKEKSNV